MKAKLESAESGGFVEIVGYEDVYQGLANRISYGIKFSIHHNKITGTASSSELDVDGTTTSHSLILSGKVTAFTVSKLIPVGDHLFYKKAQGIINFTLSDGTRYTGMVKGTFNSGGGYRMETTGKFIRSNFHDTDYTFTSSMSVASGTYSW